MNKINTILLLGLVSLFSFSCGSEAVEKEASYTKEEVVERKAQGDTRDYCDVFGWYDDGVCDEFCTETDGDCVVQCDGLPVCDQEYFFAVSNF